MRTGHLKNLSNEQLAEELVALIRWIAKERIDITFIEKIQRLINNILLEVELRAKRKWFLPHLVNHINFLKHSTDFEETLKTLHETEKLINSEI
jgi:hypothetical protein